MYHLHSLVVVTIDRASDSLTYVRLGTASPTLKEAVFALR